MKKNGSTFSFVKTDGHTDVQTDTGFFEHTHEVTDI